MESDLLKTSAGRELFHAIAEAIRGRRYITPLIAERMEEQFIRGSKLNPGTFNLTLRQREVLQLLGEGYSMKQTAAILNVTPRTVAFHKYSIMQEYQLKSNADLLRFAIQQGTLQS